MEHLHAAVHGGFPHAQKPRDAPRHQARERVPQRVRRGEARGSGFESVPQQPDGAGEVHGGHAVLHVPRVHPRSAVRVEQRHLEPRVPPVRARRAQEPVQQAGIELLHLR